MGSRHQGEGGFNGEGVIQQQLRCSGCSTQFVPQFQGSGGHEEKLSGILPLRVGPVVEFVNRLGGVSQRGPRAYTNRSVKAFRAQSVTDLCVGENTCPEVPVEVPTKGSGDVETIVATFYPGGTRCSEVRPVHIHNPQS